MRKIILRLFIFIIISIAIFYTVFGPIGSFLLNGFQDILGWLFGLIPHVSQNHIMFVPLDILHSGLFPVIITLLGFLPQVMILFAVLELLKSIPWLGQYQHLMLGFGCTTLAVSTMGDNCLGNKASFMTQEEGAGRSPASLKSPLEGVGGGICYNKKCRDITLLTFIPCGAKMPIMMIFVNGFFNFGFLVLYGLYIGAVMIGLFSWWLMRRINKTKDYDTNREENNEIIPRFNYKNIFTNTRDFLKRLGLPIITISLILYFLANYTFHLQYTSKITQTMLYNIATIFSPIFAPIGLGSPIIITALIFGLIGKEMMIVPLATLGIPIYTMAATLSFMVFAILYPVCISAIIAIRNKTNTKFAVGLAMSNLAVAYVFAFMVFTLVN